jgi:hypothetical protein
MVINSHVGFKQVIQLRAIRKYVKKFTFHHKRFEISAKFAPRPATLSRQILWNVIAM